MRCSGVESLSTRMLHNPPFSLFPPAPPHHTIRVSAESLKSSSRAPLLESGCETMSGNGKKVAVVTGANRGIGLEIARQLARKYAGEGDVVVAARSGDVAAEVAARIAKEEGGLDNVRGHQLDIEDQKSVEKLRDFLNEK